MGLAHPARHLVELKFRVRGGFDRIDTDALLAGVAPFLFHVAGCQGRRRHQQDQELDRINDVSDLLPPADAAFEENAVLFDDDVGRIALEPVAETRGLGLAVLAGVGEEHLRHLGQSIASQNHMVPVRQPSLL